MAKKPAKPARTIWGTTMVDLQEIVIFLDDSLTDAWAETHQNSHRPHSRGFVPYIILHPDVLDRPAEVLDEILCHEFVHVLEGMFARELKESPPNCTAAATVFGRHLPRMLKYLRQVGVKP